MSYSLNFYLASLDDIQSSLSKPDSPWFNNAYPLWLEAGEMEDDENSQALWRQVVAAISEAARRCAADPNHSFIVQGDAALAIATGIDGNSEFIDAMNHSSSSGELFRDQFLRWMGRYNFKQPLLSEWLTERPLSGLVAESYPSWGYLRHAEVLELISQWRKPPQDLDEDREEWLRQLIDILKVARMQQSDVVTVYS
ncbi:MAG: hypothetical protein R3F37_00225 [Candidatus Competibacteraceae bacterium]